MENQPEIPTCFEIDLEKYKALVRDHARLEKGVEVLHLYLLEHPEYLRFSPVINQASAWLTNLYNGKQYDE